MRTPPARQKLHGTLIDSWRSAGLAAIVPVVNRIARSVVFLLIAAQLLLAVPAMAGVTGAAASATADCADMPGAHGDRHCPCCPDGASSVAGCMSACTAASALPALLPTIAVDRVAELVRHPTFEFISSLADPPLKPPPII